MGKYGPNTQHCLFKMKFGTYNNWSILNSVVMFNFSLLDKKYPFWANLVQKGKTVWLRWNLVPPNVLNSTMMFICLALDLNYILWVNLVWKIIIVCLRWNFVTTLIRSWTQMVMFIRSVLNMNFTFWANLVRKIMFV